ncbi:MAG: ABC transporter permease, partial [Blastocatellia bacterium]
MRSIEQLRLRFRSILFRSRVEDELDDEIRFYVERQIAENLADGMDLKKARHTALRQFGGVLKIKEECRDMRRVNYIENLIQDLRYGLRILAKNPGFTAVAVITLALGIGANTAIFSLVDGILLKSLPYPEPDRLVSLTEYYPKGGFELIRDQSKTMDAAYYWEGEEFNLAQQGLPPVRLNGSEVSAELFSVLGVHAAIGRTFHTGENSPGNDRTVILSHALWERQFGHDPAVIGRSIVIEGTVRQIVGVMPAGFGFPSTKTNIWVPIQMNPRTDGDYWGPQDSVIARLKPGVTIEQAAQEVKSFIPRILAACPFPLGSNWNNDSTAIPLRRDIVGDVRSKLLILLGAVSLILLMACANVANLLLARSAARTKEVAIRSALGAGRSRVVRQLLTESLLLALGGGAMGLIFARGGLA